MKNTLKYIGLLAFATFAGTTYAHTQPPMSPCDKVGDKDGVVSCIYLHDLIRGSDTGHMLRITLGYGDVKGGEDRVIFGMEECVNTQSTALLFKEHHPAGWYRWDVEILNDEGVFIPFYQDTFKYNGSNIKYGEAVQLVAGEEFDNEMYERCDVGTPTYSDLIHVIVAE